MKDIKDEDINILISHCNIDKDKAKKLLILNEGNIVESIFMMESGNCDFEKIKKEKEKYQEDETEDFIIDTSKQENIKKYREIVDYKDSLYYKNKEEKEEAKKNPQKKNLSIEELYFLKKKNKYNNIKIL